MTPPAPEPVPLPPPEPYWEVSPKPEPPVPEPYWFPERVVLEPNCDESTRGSSLFARFEACAPAFEAVLYPDIFAVFLSWGINLN